jgi:hypothetical protein
MQDSYDFAKVVRKVTISRISVITAVEMIAGLIWVYNDYEINTYVLILGALIFIVFSVFLVISTSLCFDLHCPTCNKKIYLFHKNKSNKIKCSNCRNQIEAKSLNEESSVKYNDNFHAIKPTPMQLSKIKNFYLNKNPAILLIGSVLLMLSFFSFLIAIIALLVSFNELWLEYTTFFAIFFCMLTPIIIFGWRLKVALSKGVIKKGKIVKIKPVVNFMPRAFTPFSLIKVEIDNEIYNIYADLQEYEIMRLTKHKSTLPFLCYKNKAFLVTIPVEKTKLPTNDKH